MRTHYPQAVYKRWKRLPGLKSNGKLTFIYHYFLFTGQDGEAFLDANRFWDCAQVSEKMPLILTSEIIALLRYITNDVHFINYGPSNCKIIAILQGATG